MRAASKSVHKILIDKKTNADQKQQQSIVCDWIDSSKAAGIICQNIA